MRAKQIIVKEDLSMDTRVMETDHEVQMARADLFKLAKYSVELHKMLKNVSEAQGLEGWVQAKITKAADYISSVKHHLEYEQAEVDIPQDDASIEVPVEIPAEGMNELKQEFSDDDIRKAIAIANHPEFKGGNYTGASEKINSMKPGLADHPKVAKALQQANENKGDK
jgi:acylphosphatase